MMGTLISRLTEMIVPETRSLKVNHWKLKTAGGEASVGAVVPNLATTSSRVPAGVVLPRNWTTLRLGVVA